MAEKTLPPCPLCCESSPGRGKLICLTAKGIQGIAKASKERGVTIPDLVAGTYVHEDCRHSFTNKKNIRDSIKRELSDITNIVKPGQKRRSYDNKSDCLFCGEEVTLSDGDATSVKTDGFVYSICKAANLRKDEWALDVKGRLEYYGYDLHAADVVYHKQCDINFRTGKAVPAVYSAEPSCKKPRTQGRPVDQEKIDAFSRVCSYLETKQQATIPELAKKMEEFIVGKEGYSKKWLKTKLLEHYGSDINITTRNGCDDLVTFEDTIDKIAREFFLKCQIESHADKTLLLVKTAAKLIRTGIKNAVYPRGMDSYPTSSDLEVKKIWASTPELLKYFLECILEENNPTPKSCFLAQTLVHNICPRSVITPLNFGIAASTYTVHKCRNIVDILNALGVCSSYSEVQRYIHNAAANNSTEPLGKIEDTMNVLFAADNVDHNLGTIDGKGTFHGLGILASVTPGNEKTSCVPRKKIADLKTQVFESKIPIYDYTMARKTLSRVHYTDMLDALTTASQDCSTRSVDLLWELSARFTSTTPSWNGMMCSMTSSKSHPGKSSYYFLPMIDLPSTDYSCLYSALRYVNNLALEHKIQTILTFDQPLYWKALEILRNLAPNDEMNRTVVLLAPFHTFMNYLGAVGYLYSGLGLEELIGELYAENVIQHIISGKAVSRSFRFHLLFDQTITNEITAPLLNDEHFIEVLLGCEKLYENFSAGRITMEELSTSAVLEELQKLVGERKEAVASLNDTNRMWVSYLELIQIARDMIRSERTGDWKLHLETTRKCLVPIAAAGHHNYVKSLHLYLQQMDTLEECHPEVYRMLSSGHFVSRRTDKYWAGIPSDLGIEQILMRSLKTKGGLTRGSGMGEMQRLLWILAAPTMAEMNDALIGMTGKCVSRSEQHKELSNARTNRDQKDFEILRDTVAKITPFESDIPSLRNIVTGLEAPASVTVGQYKKTGLNILKKMKDQDVLTYKFARKDRAINMTTATNSVKLPNEGTIDSALLFQRMVAAAQTGDISLYDVLEYELAPFPPALFQTKSVPLKADKPPLAHAILKTVETKEAKSETVPEKDTNAEMPESERSKEPQDNIPKTDHYVIDGGSLLQRVPWTSGSRYLNIAASYAKCVTVKYFRPTVVFDGYGNGPNIKDSTHVRRNSTCSTSIINMERSLFKSKKESVLSNESNKDTLIKMIMEELIDRLCRTTQSSDDADVDIAKAAVNSSRMRSTTLIGEDTDLLILMLHYYDPNNEALFFRTDKKQTNKRLYDIKAISESIGKDLCSNLLFVHAFTGCDSTSRLAGLSKPSALNKYLKNPELQNIAAELCLPGKGQDEVTSLGLDAMKMFYGQKTTDSMTSIRYKLLMSKIAKSSSFVSPSRLPPTESAAKYHIYRVYYQVMEWSGHTNAMDPLEWGWMLNEGKYIPITMDNAPAPEYLLKIIHCNCKTGCQSTNCSCKKYGLPCHSGCGKCQQDHCMNGIQPETEEEQLDENEHIEIDLV